MSRELIRDLSMHLQQQVGEVMRRHCTAAGLVVSHSDVIFMMMELAVANMLSAAATTAAMCKDEADRATAFDHCLKLMSEMATTDRARSLAKAADLVAEGRR